MISFGVGSSVLGFLATDKKEQKTKQNQEECQRMHFLVCTGESTYHGRSVQQIKALTLWSISKRKWVGVESPTVPFKDTPSHSPPPVHLCLPSRPSCLMVLLPPSSTTWKPSLDHVPAPLQHVLSPKQCPPDFHLPFVSYLKHGLTKDL